MEHKMPLNSRVIGAVLLYLLAFGSVADEYLGQTSGLHSPEQGYLGLYGACQAEYGPNAVVCSTKQLLESPTGPSAVTSGDRLIRPSIVASGDLNGIDFTGTIVPANNIGCNGPGNGGTASVITPEGVLKITECNSYRVACCR